MGAINVPTHKTKLYLKFNEYVQVKDAKSLFLSPPLEKAPKYRLKEKVSKSHLKAISTRTRHILLT